VKIYVAAAVEALMKKERRGQNWIKLKLSLAQKVVHF
jgi:hypothetical protein